MANTGVYLKEADLTHALAVDQLEIVSGSATADLGVYFNAADENIKALARQNNVPVESIAIDESGNLLDFNLKMYGLNTLYALLFSDNAYTTNSQDTTPLSDSFSYDKYVRASKDATLRASEHAQRVSANTIMNTANTANSAVAMFNRSRG
jgi:hypothetical protein